MTSSTKTSRRDFLVGTSLALTAATVGSPVFSNPNDTAEILQSIDPNNTVVVINVDHAVFDECPKGAVSHMGYDAANHVTDRILSNEEIIALPLDNGTYAYSTVGYWNAISNLGNEGISVILVSEKYAISEIDQINDNRGGWMTNYAYPAIASGKDGSAEIRATKGGEIQGTDMNSSSGLDALMSDPAFAGKSVIVIGNEDSDPYAVMHAMNDISPRQKILCQKSITQLNTYKDSKNES